MAEKYPAMDAEIKQRIKEGRWEVVGGMWVEPDLNMPDGESQVRSLLLGKRWYKQHYGVDVRIGWNPDSFGYNWQLPQIYKRAGVDYFVTQKMTWNDTNQLPFKLFWWQSPDGSKVLSYFPHDYANDNLDPIRLSGDLAVARERSPGMSTMMDLYGIGDHGGGPTRTILDQGEHWAHAPDAVTPQMHFGLAQTFFHCRRTNHCLRLAHLELPVHCQGLQISYARTRQDGHSYVERRDVLRIPPRRHDHAGRP